MDSGAYRTPPARSHQNLETLPLPCLYSTLKMRLFALWLLIAVAVAALLGGPGKTHATAASSYAAAPFWWDPSLLRALPRLLRKREKLTIIFPLQLSRLPIRFGKSPLFGASPRRSPSLPDDAL